MPGVEAVYGYNMVNISHWDTETQKMHDLFENPVLIKTLYYPANSNDTLNGIPVSRDFILVTVYDEDTNKDGFINVNDLRKMYFFNIEGHGQVSLLPDGYSAIKSEHDPENDFMYVFAKLDENKNGIADNFEPIHVFWIDLEKPTNNGMLY